ncbi:hypothetical protein TeGR_g10950 [Tetraparma gracilis]|uniref:WKF domain-containing protein n=1 Tax=Tetraparma gracilis TaxID=2962635 RepID=A0ABQ6M9Y2_9STRA|nr:hypothetical protein TeGR_g10950 [Tetraparma gracilis]
MGSSKNRTGVATTPKKKRVSKHVLVAAARQAEKSADGSGGGGGDSDGGGSDGGEDGQQVVEPASDAAAKALKRKEEKKNNKKPKKKANAHTKPPAEAGNYLVLWKLDKANPGTAGWKFNKNTQSWLLRHMYNDKLVVKATFAALCEYMVGLTGKSREDKRAEAKELCAQYKAWAASDEGKAAEAAAADAEGGGAEDAQFTGANFAELGPKTKRKVYKRARLCYDVLKS